MAEATRIRFIAQKRTAIKKQITTLKNIFEQKKLDNNALELRMNRLTELFNSYETLNEELDTLCPDQDNIAEFTEIMTNFYSLAGNIKEHLKPPTTSSADDQSVVASVSSLNNVNSHKNINTKLPKTSMPVFDGSYENWISFQDEFKAIIESHSELTDATKFQYLKKSLTSDAANKIKGLAISDQNYEKAWNILTRAYGVKHLLISRYYNLLLQLPVQERETAKGLEKLADDASQHVIGLESLGENVSSGMLVAILESKLPKNTMQEWEKTLDRETVPTIDDLYVFLYKTAARLSKRPISSSSGYNKHEKSFPPFKKPRFDSNREARKQITFATTTVMNCMVCRSGEHPLYRCSAFKALPVKERINVVKRANLCFNCMRSHRGKPCKMTGCLLCVVAASDELNCHSTTADNPSPQLLASAIILVEDRDRKLIRCRVLLDTCSTANFVTESFAKRLRIKKQPCSIPVAALNSVNTLTKNTVQLSFRSTRNEHQKTLTFLTIPKISNLLPSEMFPRESIKIPANVPLADPEFHIPRPIDMLIGAGPTFSLFAIGQINLSSHGNDLYLQKTRLGWVIAGNAPMKQSSKEPACHFTQLETQVAKFWLTEEVTKEKPRSKEDKKCEVHFIENVTRAETGRYTVRLPFRESKKGFGDSYVSALKRFLALERKLNISSELKDEYSKAIDTYINAGYMSPVDKPHDDGFYLPHHAVIKTSSTTTKVRIVFDASAKGSSGVALNDLLMPGPTIQEKLFAHLIRFRFPRYALTADIEKMYLQVSLHKDDRKYQYVIWRENGEIETFQLNTVTFGVTSSAFLAIRTLHKLADDEKERYPRAAEELKENLYVDDFMSGAEEIERARMIRDKMIDVLKLGGFNIRQWASNSEQVLEGLDEENINKKFLLDKNCALKTLGVSWHAKEDKIFYSVEPIGISAKLTKRNILSEIAKIFDPLGLLGPVILQAKKIMQSLWQCKVEWDESVPADLHTAWSNFVSQLTTLNNLSFERRFVINNQRRTQILGFCDASEIGYGACMYVRSLDADGNIICRLLCAKSRVAPIKTVSIPRLELCGTLILSRLYKEVSDALEFAPSEVFFWSDSTIVLHWLRTSPNLLHTYVANRIAEIQENTDVEDWRHVRSEDNPADALSRGQSPSEFLRNDLWRSGPSWVRKDQSMWPSGKDYLKAQTKQACFVLAVASKMLTYRMMKNILFFFQVAIFSPT
ncbi:uncharacterized protein LOC135168628 [Diachasmimorpha longicaudata]|uniref:uncharacterized protein LOC135168628 n=1 Tax=Diachasmimorpha longicaudata TaxID=58733 RepID=UPI0030B8F544